MINFIALKGAIVHHAPRELPSSLTLRIKFKILFLFSIFATVPCYHRYTNRIQGEYLHFLLDTDFHSYLERRMASGRFLRPALRKLMAFFPLLGIPAQLPTFSSFMERLDPNHRIYPRFSNDWCLTRIALEIRKRG